MKVFRLLKSSLNEVEQVPFQKEKDIQSLVENNTDTLFNLRFIQTELSVDKFNES